MTPGAARSSTVCGALALVGAALAVALDAKWLVVVAALLALVAAVLALLPAYQARLRATTDDAPLAPAAAPVPVDHDHDHDHDHGHEVDLDLDAAARTGAEPSAMEAAVDAAAARAVAAATGARPVDEALDPPITDLDADARSAALRFEADAIQAREDLVRLMRTQQDRFAASTASAPAGAPPDPTEPSASRADVILDRETGLFSEVFFDASLAKRVSASRRGLRPLSVAVLEVEVDLGSPMARPAPGRPVAEALLQVFREADTVARADDGSYLVLLEDTPENGAVWSLERLRRRISETLPGHTTRAGVSCYPAYGFDADQLLDQARGALELAKEWPQDRVEVTTESPD